VIPFVCVLSLLCCSHSTHRVYINFDSHLQS
jgi:hypothetical protein